MSRVIKVEDQVYNNLDMLREKNETFSDVVSNLLDARVKVMELLNVLEGQLKYWEWKREKLAEVGSGTGR